MTTRLDPRDKALRAAARRHRVCVPRWACSICGDLYCKAPRGMAHPPAASLARIYKEPYLPRPSL